MQAVIPAAGQGTRLYPQTHTKPKAMVRVAGRPVVGHILSSLAETRIDDVVLVVGGPMQDQIVEYTQTAFEDRFTFQYVEQRNAEGLGHSVLQAAEAVGEEPMLIALGDMLFENGYKMFLEEHDDLHDPDATIGVKRVDEPRHYGVVELSDDNRITGLVEKPEDPPSNYAISGVYIIENSRKLFRSLRQLVERDLRGAGNEYQLTDGLQRMIDDGAVFGAFEVEDWYDCGRPETLLEANRVLLRHIDSDLAEEPDGSVVIPPVDFGSDVTVSGSVVGPNVSLDDGATVVDSIVSETIVGQKARIEGVNLEESIVGDNAHVLGEANELNIGDNSTISF